MYDTDNILDIDCESYINVGLQIPAPLQIAHDYFMAAENIKSILQSTKRKIHQQHELDNMNHYKEEAYAVSYFLRGNGIPGLGIERMKKYAPKFQRLSKYDKRFLDFLAILEQ